MHRLMMILALMLAPMLSYAQPACWPAPHGDGVGKTQGMTDDGEWHAWHCPGTYDWSTVLLVKRTGYVLRLPEDWSKPMYRRISEAEVSSSPVSGQRAPVGEECACYHSRAVVGNTTYCMIPREPVQPDLLAVCVRAE